MITTAGRVVAVTGALLVVVGLVAGWASLVLVGTAAVVALAGAVASVRRAAELDVQRSLVPARVVVGQGATSRLHVENGSGRAVAASVAFDQVDGELVPVELARIPAGRSQLVELELPTGRRGVVAVGPLLVRRADPLGLVQVDAAFGPSEVLWVHPRHHDVPPLPAALLRSLEGPTSDTAPQGTLTFHSLREYVRGDDLRHVHWRTSARTGTLMVRKLVDTSLPDITVLLDRTAAVWTDERFEQGIEVAASVLCACTTARFPTRLVLSSGEVVAPLDGPPAQRFLDHLTEVDRSAADGLPVTIERLASEGVGTAAVVVTGAADRLRLARLTTLRRRFAEVVVVIVRPAGQAPLGLNGVTVIDVPSSAAFADRWAGARAEVAG